MDRQEITDSVTEFGEVFSVPTDVEFCHMLIREEAREMREAAAHLLKEMCDLLYVTEWAHICGHTDTLEQLCSDEMIDSLFPIYDGVELAGLAHVLDNAFRMVHASNMSKLMPDGTVLRREDGKVLKGPNYQPPNIEALI
jgi:predicted HAD superfamily Cof-like phosphohydrolase